MFSNNVLNILKRKHSIYGYHISWEYKIKALYDMKLLEYGIRIRTQTSK